MSKSNRERVEKLAVVKILEPFLNGNDDEPQVRKFQLRVHGKLCEAFLIKKEGEFHAYINECRHLPMPLDMNAATVLNSSLTLIQCHQHGAVYEIESGVCIEGPCRGAKLYKLKIEKKGKHLLISAPPL